MFDVDTDVLRKIVEYEEKRNDDFGWTYSEVGIPPYLIIKLLNSGIIRKTEYSSNRYNRYLLVDREGVKRYIEDSSRPEPQSPQSPIRPDFSSIEGYDDIKSVIRQSLEGAPVHILLVGPPATAKTMFLSEISKIKGASFHTGGSTTKAGLMDFIIKFRPSILIIDEIDKMSSIDHAVLLTLMESGKIVETKFNRRVEIDVDIKVYAAANTTANIPQELLSRFLVFYLRPYTEDEFRRVVFNVLISRGVDEDIASYIAKNISNRTRDVRDAIKLSALCKSFEDVDKYIKVFDKYKAWSLSERR